MFENFRKSYGLAHKIETFIRRLVRLEEKAVTSRILINKAEDNNYESDECYYGIADKIADSFSRLAIKDGYVELPSNWRPIDVGPLKKSTQIHVVTINSKNTPCFFFGDNAVDVSEETKRVVFGKICKDNPWFMYHINPVFTGEGKTETAGRIAAPAGIYTLKDAGDFARNTFYPYGAKIYRVKPIRNFILVRPMIMIEGMTRKLSSLIFKK